MNISRRERKDTSKPEQLERQTCDDLHLSHIFPVDFKTRMHARNSCLSILPFRDVPYVATASCKLQAKPKRDERAAPAPVHSGINAYDACGTPCLKARERSNAA